MKWKQGKRISSIQKQSNPLLSYLKYPPLYQKAVFKI
nr:MAG TPA: hypothetical protein [Caudoviricetes sp.]DAY16249.1 MAG TPA: hypothetical protein [Caudoviricetes sp.]DAY29448.1 MAG TPA: hypothetical protein [Caudoviricetes sp.]